MYFWSIRDLVRRLGERDLSEAEAFRYFFASFTLLTIGANLPDPEKWNTWDTVGAVASVLVAVAGLIVAYRANGGSAGTAFLQRYFAISWVIFIRMFVAMFFVYLAAMIVADAAGALEEDTTSWWEAVLVIGFDVVSTLLVVKHVRRVRAARQQLEDVLAAAGPR